jgi:hypothetical protein
LELDLRDDEVRVGLVPGIGQIVESQPERLLSARRQRAGGLTDDFGQSAAFWLPRFRLT